MLEQIYAIDAVRQFFKESGARLLGAEDKELPGHLQEKTGEHWLLPVGWKLTETVIIRLGDTYPDDPPTLFMPSTTEPRDLLPHVSLSGDICTIVRTGVINPDRPLDVLLRCLDGARGILDRDWTEEEKAIEINDELSAYWNGSATRSILYKRPDLDELALEVTPSISNKNLFEVQSSTSKIFKAPVRLGMVAELADAETLNFLRAPGAYLATSRSFRASLETFCEKVSERTREHKTFDLFVFLVAKLGDKECVLAGLIPQSIKAKGKNREQLFQAIVGVLVHKGLEHWQAEDISARRLLRRTTGPHFDERILTRRVAIIGCGSLGSMVADGLARCGVRSFFLCDSEILNAENLLRHQLTKNYLGFSKVSGLKLALVGRVPEAVAITCTDDIRLRSAISALIAFNPDLIFFATGDTNTDLTMSRLLPQLGSAALAFSWADHNLTAGHLIYQPSRAQSVLRELHDETTGQYVYSSTDTPFLFRESGCQNSYSPYSGLAMAQFAASASMKLVDWLQSPPTTHEVLRLGSGVSWERMS